MNNQVRLLIPSETEMRTAIATRDSTYDGVFYYGVITTGVFCLPSCAARPARAENLRFFFEPQQAIDAGLRSCKRCHPIKTLVQREKLIEIARFILKHADKRLTLKELSQQVGLQVTKFQKLFTATFGVSPKAYQDAARIKKLKKSLHNGHSVMDAIFDAGFGSTSRLYGQSIRNIGMTPSAYRAGGKGEVINYACRLTVLGTLLMAATDRGVCFAQFGDSETALLKQLQTEFPHATVTVSSAQHSIELNDWINALDAHLAKNAPRPDLPLDLVGSAFQIKVWRYLLSTREGDVVSYSEVARNIEKPKAVRAAASACGANRIAVLVPCHRVLRGDGSLGGYRWGLERKRTLLDVERARQ